MPPRLRALRCAASLAALLAGSAATVSHAQDLGRASRRPSSTSASAALPLADCWRFVIPGTETCLRLFGQARFDYRLREQFFRATAPSGFRSTMTVGLDAITPTAFGRLRTVAQVSTVYRAGEQRNATAIRQGFAIDGDFSAIQDPPGPQGRQHRLLYSGLSSSPASRRHGVVFVFRSVLCADLVGTAWRAAPFNVNLIAYTASLAPGLTASLSAEDPTTRQIPVVNGTRGRTSFNYATDGTNFLSQGGLALPHFVTTLQLEQAWGSAKVAGVLTNIRPSGLLPTTDLWRASSTLYGFAAIGAVKVNLPMIGPATT